MYISNNFLLSICISCYLQGGIISKIRRRLTVQGDSETIDGAALDPGAIRDKLLKEQATEDVSNTALQIFTCAIGFLFDSSILIYYIFPIFP